MIQFNKINIAFDNRILFDDFTLSISKGEKVLISAPSGKGKSTLMKTLLGFQRPDSGEIIVAGEVLSKETLQAIRSQIAYVSQDVELGQHTCEKLLKEVFNFKNNRHIPVDKEIFVSYGEQFGLPKGFLKKSIHQLSGGERQRLGFVVCVLLDRPIWVLDEITSGLDRELKERLVKYVLESDKTVLITSHDEIWLKQSSVRVVKL